MMSESVEAKQNRAAVIQRRFRAFWWLLLFVNISLVASAIPPVVRGDPDGYRNEHLRSLLGPIGGIHLCIAFLLMNPQRPRPYLAIAFAVLAFGFAMAGIVLAST